jgi:hypothetical protein
MFFPDLLDIFVLTTCPLPIEGSSWRALPPSPSSSRASCSTPTSFAPLVSPQQSIRPICRGSSPAICSLSSPAGLFAAVFILALQGSACFLFSASGCFAGSRFFLQGFSSPSVDAPVVVSRALRRGSGLSQSGSPYALYCPPFWFLGIYQRLLEGPSALPIYVSLAQTGCAALLITIAVAMLAYPLPTCAACVNSGRGSRHTRHAQLAALPLSAFLHATLVRQPSAARVFHFISQTLLRVSALPHLSRPLWRSGPLRCRRHHSSFHRVRTTRFAWKSQPTACAPPLGSLPSGPSPGCAWPLSLPATSREAGYSASCMAGRRSFRRCDGSSYWPPKSGSFFVESLSPLAACLAFHAFAPPELLTRPVIAGQLLIAAGMCVLLTDVLFLNVRIVPFTGDDGERATQPRLHSPQILRLSSRGQSRSHSPLPHGLRTAASTTFSLARCYSRCTSVTPTQLSQGDSGALQLASSGRRRRGVSHEPRPPLLKPLRRRG